MAIFKYIVKNKNGKEEGILTAEDQKSAEQILKGRKLVIFKISEVKSRASTNEFASLKERSDFEKRISKFMIGGKKIEQTLLQLAALLQAGVPILNSFQTLASQSPYFLSRLLYCASNKIHSGTSLTVSLREEATFLGNVIIGLLSAGEANGTIDQMCEYASDLMAERRAVKGDIIQAMVYPVVVILVTIGIVLFLMYKVIPKIMKFLNTRSGKLPAITQALVDVTHFLQANGLYFIIAPIFIALAIYFCRKHEEMGIYIDHAALYIPVIGKAFRASANTLWSRTMSTLLASGINIITALDFTINSQNNLHYRDELRKVKNYISQGHPLSTGIQVTEIGKYSPFAESMIIVGENTGRIDESLQRVSEFSQAELKSRISLMSKLIEPALFIVVGGIVGFVYIAFFMGLMAASKGG